MRVKSASRSVGRGSQRLVTVTVANVWHRLKNTPMADCIRARQSSSSSPYDNSNDDSDAPFTFGVAMAVEGREDGGEE